MATVGVRSRILQYFTPNVLQMIYEICRTSQLKDNNEKVDAVLAILDNNNVDYIELGPGTNRLAILIDNYVFKIALDKWGMLDNLNEYCISKELQPFVAKTYETNELISVHEYVTVISSDEFREKKPEIQKILALLSESYLLGDVGTVAKNFCNWGYRDDGQLVILDFAYIYKITGEEIICPKCKSIIEYDSNFHSLHCSNMTCKKKFTFMDIRRKIPMEAELKEIELVKKASVLATKPFDYFEIDENGSTVSNKENEEETNMYSQDVDRLKDYIDEAQDEVLQEELFDSVLDNIDAIMAAAKDKKKVDIEEIVDRVDEETDEIEQILEMLQMNNTPEVKKETTKITTTVETVVEKVVAEPKDETVIVMTADELKQEEDNLVEKEYNEFEYEVDNKESTDTPTQQATEEDNSFSITIGEAIASKYSDKVSEEVDEKPLQISIPENTNVEVPLEEIEEEEPTVWHKYEPDEEETTTVIHTGPVQIQLDLDSSNSGNVTTSTPISPNEVRDVTVSFKTDGDGETQRSIYEVKVEDKKDLGVIEIPSDISYEDALRKELGMDLDTQNVDEYDHIYDEIDNENLNAKYNKHKHLL